MTQIFTRTVPISFKKDEKICYSAQVVFGLCDETTANLFFEMAFDVVSKYVKIYPTSPEYATNNCSGRMAAVKEILESIRSNVFNDMIDNVMLHIIEHR